MRILKPIKINKLYQVFKLLFKVIGQNQRVDSYFKLQNFASSLHHLHFNSNSFSEEEKGDFFKNQLEEIELETHGYCNRKCEFCPNRYIDRMDKNQILPKEVFNRVIDELSNVDFKGTLKLHRYNEPLALDLIFDRIAYARKKLPRATIGFHSNGDYITLDILRQCEQIGLDFIYINRYLSSRVSKSKLGRVAQQHCVQYLKKNNLKAKRIKEQWGNLVRYVIPMKMMSVVLYVPDLKNYGDDRGGFLKELSAKKVRISPCISPFKRMFIDWTGDVLPCCNLLSDIKSHRNYILGNIKNSPLQDIYFSDKSNRIRKMLVDFNEKEGPCRYCKSELFHSGTATKKLMKDRLETLCTSTNNLPI